ncbi:MAG: DNA-binding protein WhiA [Lachnospiraceae bacterium]|nr:DNA-binding protein WhiA [Lachnospiraceae bacterium]
MSFSMKIKEEIEGIYAKTLKERVAEIAGMTAVLKDLREEGYSFFLNSENRVLILKLFTLLDKTIRIKPYISVRLNPKSKHFTYSLGILSDYGEKGKVTLDFIGRREISSFSIDEFKSFIRGVFIAAGTMNNPNSSYRLEMILSDKKFAEVLVTALKALDVTGKIIQRKSDYVVYIKEAESISNFLTIIGAFNSVLEFENIRVLKEISNSVNRKVNCDTANIKKTVDAGLKQKEIIDFIDDAVGINSIDKKLQEVAVIRSADTDLSLAEIADLTVSNVSKSGVNHRFRKLEKIAKSLGWSE